MNTEILSVQKKTVEGLEIVYSLQTEYCGSYVFGDKWLRSTYADSETITIEGDHWHCGYYTIGKDLTRGQAVREFYRDREAFDVYLTVSVLKCDIELLEDTVIFSDYSYKDDDGADELLSYLIADYAQESDYIENAKNKLMELIA